MRYWSDPRARRWLIWGSLAAAFLLVNLHRLSTAVLADRLMAAFDATGVELGNLHAAFFYIYATLQLPAGVLVDRLGTRWTAAGGLAVMNLGVVVFGLSRSYAPAFVGRALVGLGASVIFVSVLRHGANWFRPTEFATMNGLTVSMAGLGGMLATTPLALAIAAAGWRTTFLGLAGFGLLVALVVAVVVRDTPASAGLDEISGVGPTPDRSLAEIRTSAGRVLREPETWLLGVVLFCSTGVSVTVLGLWGIPYLVQTYGLSVTRASTYTLLGSLGLLLGPPAIGWLSDRLERRTALMVVGGVLYAATFALLSAAGDPPRAAVGVAFFAAGGLVGVFSLAYAVVQERHDSATSGVSIGTVNTLAFFGPALVPTAMGAVLDGFWTGETVAGARVYTLVGYRVAFGLAAVFGVVALAGSLWLHYRIER
ncbi:MAG TPA: MFS transporter [Halobacteriales archaeon]|nr:MFS transporter [Halobacteriales archaeon]